MIGCIYIARAGAAYDASALQAVRTNAGLRGSSPVALAVSGATVSMTCADDTEDLLSEALAIVIGDGYVARINGQRPDADGQFWLHMDRCFGWRPFTPAEAKTVSGSTDVPAYVHTYAKPYPVHGGTGSYVLYNNEYLGGGMALTNNCVACGTCERLLEIRRQAEWLKMAFNSLKDSNLYQKSVCDARLAYLTQSRADIPSNCSLRTDAYETPMELPVPPGSIGVRLMGQYVTMVHMWNYAVAQNNSFTEIHSTPEDPAGFYVQTKKSLPSCDTSVVIEATISISLSSGQNYLSVFVPTPKTSFKPFREGDTTYDATVSVTATSATSKTVVAKFYTGGTGGTPMARPSASGAGTYLLTAKFLPFKVTKITYGASTTPVSLLPFDWGRYTSAAGHNDIVEWDEPDPSGGATPAHSSAVVPTSALGYLNATASASVNTSTTILSPNQNEYNEYKVYPSKSVQSRNMWSIVIAWRIVWPGTDGAGPTEKTWRDTYVFETNAVREYLDGILTPVEVGVIDGTVTSVTNQT